MIETDNHADIDLRSLRALVTVADQGSFRGAARELGYTQSAISHQIATLERSLETPLFTRPGGRGATALTPAGNAVYRRARRVLGEVQTLAADVQAAVTGERQTLRIGTFQTGTTELLPPALRTLREERPDVEVQLDRDPHQRRHLRTARRRSAGLRAARQPRPRRADPVDPAARRPVGDPDPA